MKEKVSQETSYHVYVLKCADSSLYTGYTTDLEKRIAAHNGEGKTASERAAGAKYTKSRRPVELVYSETCETKEAAMSREYAIKQLTRLQKQKLIAS